MMKIKVPATTANIGPGFDSFGLALSLYLEVEVHELSNEWIVQHDLGDKIPYDKENLIVDTALKVFPNLKPHRLKLNSSIPLERGLGSSSSAIVAGVELANLLGDLNLSTNEKVDLATEIEGHPDNVAPAILGDFVVSGMFNNKTLSMKVNFSDIDVAVVVPSWSLSTKKSREVLPKELLYKEAIVGSSVANLMLAALFNGNKEVAGEMMEQDIWHEKYRMPLVPHLGDIRSKMRNSGAYATCLSGAGPTVAVFFPKDKKESVMKELEQFSSIGQIIFLNIDSKGSHVCYS